MVIPHSLRPSMLESIHIGHMGMTICIRRAQDIMFWPKMSSEIQDMVGNCSVCLERRDSNYKEPLISHPIPDRPWQVVSTDLFTWNDQDFVVVVDKFSRFIEVERLSSSRSSLVIRKIKSIFHFLQDMGCLKRSFQIMDLATHYMSLQSSPRSVTSPIPLPLPIYHKNG